MDMTQVINQMVVLFLMLAIGYICGKTKVFSEESNLTLSRAVIYIANPALIINTVTSGQITGTKSYTLLLVGMSALFYVVVPIVAKIFTLTIPFTRKNRNTYQALYCFSNCGFMGIPVINALYGAEAIFYVAIFMIPFNVLVYTYGVLLLSSHEEGKQAKIEVKKIFNPVVVASLLTLLIYFTGMKTPYIVNETVALLGAITTPLAMVTIGSNLSLIPLRDVFLDWRMYVFAIFRLLLFPMAIWFVFRWFVQDKMLLNVMTVVAAMPIAANVTLISNEYGGDASTIAKATFMTTLLSLFSIPILAILIL